jgi:hypothetical protein
MYIDLCVIVVEMILNPLQYRNLLRASTFLSRLESYYSLFPIFTLGDLGSFWMGTKG